jgi:hypothetical protein
LVPVSPTANSISHANGAAPPSVSRIPVIWRIKGARQAIVCTFCLLRYCFLSQLRLLIRRPYVTPVVGLVGLDTSHSSQVSLRPSTCCWQSAGEAQSIWKLSGPKSSAGVWWEHSSPTVGLSWRLGFDTVQYGRYAVTFSGEPVQLHCVIYQKGPVTGWHAHGSETFGLH